MSSSKELTVDDVMRVACMMSQELQEFVDDAVECGSDLPGTRALIKDFDKVANRWVKPWQEEILSVDGCDSSLNI